MATSITYNQRSQYMIILNKENYYPFLEIKLLILLLAYCLGNSSENVVSPTYLGCEFILLKVEDLLQIFYAYA